MKNIIVPLAWALSISMAQAGCPSMVDNTSQKVQEICQAWRPSNTLEQVYLQNITKDLYGRFKQLSLKEKNGVQLKKTKGYYDVMISLPKTIIIEGVSYNEVYINLSPTGNFMRLNVEQWSSQHFPVRRYEVYASSKWSYCLEGRDYPLYTLKKDGSSQWENSEYSHENFQKIIGEIIKVL